MQKVNVKVEQKIENEESKSESIKKCREKRK